MHLYIHEFDDPKDKGLQEVRDFLFDDALKDYQTRTGTKIRKPVVETTSHGKPYFPKAKNLHFSISHSGRYWICLFDTDNLGVDIEDYSTRKMSAGRFKSISERFYVDDEIEYVSSGALDDISDEDEADDETKNRFFRIWTAKESYLKYTGNGFAEGMRTFSVLDGRLDHYFKNVPVDPHVVLTYCTMRDTNLDELINI